MSYRSFRRGLFVAVALAVLAVHGRSQETPSETTTAKVSPPAIVDAKSAPTSSKTEVVTTASGTKVMFPGEAGIVMIETAAGEKIRIDTNARTADSTGGNTTVDSKELAATTSAAKPVATPSQRQNLDFERGYEPYDYRVVNVPTPKNVPKGSWNLVFTHRFTQPVHPLDSSAPNLFGLDSFGVAAFGLTYGVTDKFYLSAYRSPVCQRGICRTIEIGGGYNFISHEKKSPVAFGVYGSIEGNDNFTEEYTYNLQAKISARAGKRVYLFFAPAVHLNSNGQRRFDPRPNEYFPVATVAESFRLPTHGASFGFGASVLITREISALFDFVPRTGFKLGQIQAIRTGLFGPVTGFTLINSKPAIGFGVQKNIGLHSFALTFSNTQTTTTARYNSSNLFLPAKKFTIGFNLSRRF